MTRRDARRILPCGSREDCVVADLLFIKVPEPKTSKNRLHLDLRPEHQFTEVARLEGLGATRVDVGQGNNQTWVVMADPKATSSAYKMPIRRRSEHSGYSGTRPTSRFAPERNGPDGRPAASLPAVIRLPVRLRTHADGVAGEDRPVLRAA
jgi:hypothetical protein